MALPSRLKNKIGLSTKPHRFEIEKGQIRRFATAIGEVDPIHFDVDAAKEAGFRSLVAPPTFHAALDATGELFEKLGLGTHNTMHAEEEYEYFLPICAGDEIDVVHRVSNIYQTPAPHGTLTFYVIETRGTDKKERPVFKGRRVMVELAG